MKYHRQHSNLRHDIRSLPIGLHHGTHGTQRMRSYRPPPTATVHTAFAATAHHHGTHSIRSHNHHHGTYSTHGIRSHRHGTHGIRSHNLHHRYGTYGTYGIRSHALSSPAA